MKAGIEQAKAYMLAVRDALPSLHSPDCLYYGRAGHLRLARECGCALDDFTDEGQKIILQNSYSTIYVTLCALKPILDASEWIDAMKSGLRQCRERREALRRIHYDLWGERLCNERPF